MQQTHIRQHRIRNCVGLCGCKHAAGSICRGVTVDQPDRLFADVFIFDDRGVNPVHHRNEGGFSFSIADILGHCPAIPPQGRGRGVAAANCHRASDIHAVFHFITDAVNINQCGRPAAPHIHNGNIARAEFSVGGVTVMGEEIRVHIG